MSETEFNKLALSYIPESLVNVVDGYSNKYCNGVFYNLGIYIHVKYHDFSQNIFITYLDPNGEESSLVFMLLVKDDVDRIIDDTLKDKFENYSVSSAVSDWRIEDSDIVSACECLNSNGVLVWNCRKNERSVCNIVDSVSYR